MRNILFIASLTMSIAFAGCNMDGSNRIQGNGVVTDEQREVFSFNEIKSEGVINVILTKGDQEKAVVEADENLQPYIHVYTTGKTLIIDTDDSHNYKFTNNNVHVTYTVLEKITNDGIGNVKCENSIQSEDLSIFNNGVGSIDLDVECNSIKAEQKGVGSLKLKGNTVFLKLVNSGVGSANSSNMHAKYVDVRNTGVGSTEVYADKEISIQSTGVGSVKYRGNASVKEIDASGVGSVKKID